MGTEKLQKNSEDQGLGTRAEGCLPLCSSVGGFFQGYSRMLKIL